jgi:hypothetical protein
MREQEYIGCIYASAGKSIDYTILLPFPNTLDVCADDERVGGRVWIRIVCPQLLNQPTPHRG